jgi:hypothetical protein
MISIPTTLTVVISGFFLLKILLKSGIFPHFSTLFIQTFRFTLMILTKSSAQFTSTFEIRWKTNSVWPKLFWQQQKTDNNQDKTFVPNSAVRKKIIIQKMALNPNYESIGKAFTQQYYQLFDDPTQRHQLVNLYNVSKINLNNLKNDFCILLRVFSTNLGIFRPEQRILCNSAFVVNIIVAQFGSWQNGKKRQKVFPIYGTFLLERDSWDVFWNSYVIWMFYLLTELSSRR